MIYGLFILYQIIALVLFGVAFYSKQEIMWALTLVALGFVMFSSYGVDIVLLNGSVEYLASQNYSFIGYFNMAFFGLGMVLGIFDIFDKYGNNVGQSMRGKNER